jgi:diguanylate cyclase (GGDEF)-like protein
MRIPLVRDLQSLFTSLVDTAYVDALTKVMTRNAYKAVTAVLGGEALGASYFDLNGFKAINDLHGHEAGDATLEHFGGSLRELVGLDERVMPFRMGGDEFLVLFPPEKLDGILPRLTELARRSLEWNGERLEFGASIGYALPSEESSMEQVVARAEMAARRAKTTRASVPVEWSADIAVEDVHEMRFRCGGCELAMVVHLPRARLHDSRFHACPNCDQPFST